MMKIRTLALVPVLLAVLAFGASAGDYGKRTMQMPEAAPMQPQSQAPFPSFEGERLYDSGIIGAGEGAYYLGTLSGIDPAANELVLRTEVPGLLGPQLADVPFRTGADTTMTVCFESAFNCESYIASERGWEVLSELEDISPIASADKRVLVIGSPETSELVHVQIVYGS